MVKKHESHQITSVHWSSIISAALSCVGSDYCFQRSKTEFALIFPGKFQCDQSAVWSGSCTVTSLWLEHVIQHQVYLMAAQPEPRSPGHFIHRGWSWTCDMQTDGHFRPAGPKDRHRTLKSDDTVAVKVPLSRVDSFHILLSCATRGCHISVGL